MKQYLPTALALICTVLIVSLILMKRNDNTQHANDTATIADFSNHLDAAQTQIAIGNGTILTLSNNLNSSQSALAVFSNRALAAESVVALDSGQLTNLNERIAGMESENQVLTRGITDLTNQMAGLVKQIAVGDASLEQAHKDYSLLENRLRTDVGERLVLERKFDNLSAVQAQMENLKKNPAQEVSAERIYAGLDIEVRSNGALHVVSPY